MTFQEKVAPPDVVPQERITGDILRGRGPRRGNLEDLLRYWRPIMRKPGGFRRCVIILADHPKLSPPQRICAWLHHETTGKWPNEGKKRRGGRRRRGPSVRRVVRGRRRRKGVDHVDVIGLDVPEYGAQMRIAREAGSILYEPIAGRQSAIDFKARRWFDATSSRIVHTGESILLPGERGALSPRHLAQTFLTPGGSGAPGPKLGRGIGPRIGGARRFRCPPGFQFGGRFSNRTLSNCGSQLFAVPGQPGTRQAVRGVRRAIGSEAKKPKKTPKGRTGKPSADLSVQAVRRLPGAQLAGIAGIGPQPVKRTNEGRRNSSVAKVANSMRKLRSKNNNVSRLVRRDGSVLAPLVGSSTLAKQRDNDDLKDAVYVTRSLKPGPSTGVPELALFGTGVRQVSFALPEGRIDVTAKKKLTPKDAGRLGRAAKTNAPDGSGFAALRNVAEATGLIELSAHSPKVSKPNQKITVQNEAGIKRTVPRWVFQLFLARGAPHRPSSKSPFALVNEKAAAPVDVKGA